MSAYYTVCVTNPTSVHPDVFSSTFTLKDAPPASRVTLTDRGPFPMRSIRPLGLKGNIDF
ncbi:hypothetical protein BBD41_12275 [Paenibacillus ihbetae]|uniref:Uncharacterized protein n=1 Tax=Paenibacillus ihbetae TaxID=1870820 RepID=A0A1B2DZY0_9BACL|nr:hypothetical protein BBD41_12275 [Paenibacillus ihbetae]